MSSRMTCSLSIHKNLIRAVDITEALSGFGRHWRSIAVDPADFQLSRSVDRMDTFISHDWQTPRGLKTLALLFHYNSRAAFYLSIIASVGGALLQQHLYPWRLLPNAIVDAKYALRVGSNHCTLMHYPDNEECLQTGLCAVTVGGVVFLFVLCMWQRCRRLFLPPPTAFLDKLCIHQTEDALKTEAILGLGAFLKASDKMAVLWSPRYFTRLWCTYELAAWRRLGRDFDTEVKFIPVVGTCGIVLLLESNTFTLFLDHYTVIYGFGAKVVWFLCMLLIMHAWRVVVGDISKVASQVESYSLLDANCFCCSVNHIHPATGQRLSCDRALVRRTIASWGLQDASPSSSVVDRLEEFHEDIRKDLRSCAGIIQSGFFSFGTVLLVVLPRLHMGCGHTVFFLARWSGQLPSMDEAALREVLAIFVGNLLLLPCSVRFCMRLCALSPMRRSEIGSPQHIIQTIGIGCVFVPVLVGSTLLSNRVLRDTSIPVVVLFTAALVFLTIYLYSYSFDQWSPEEDTPKRLSTSEQSTGQGDRSCHGGNEPAPRRSECRQEMLESGYHEERCILSL
eukprot:TRINITY_DN7665_c0_g1_i1.p1 TRINITY_DN7665_c0_g1~~TRINITY_DN7665_c0_g1_i1.p1  ORF type:complete len:645 (+),score=35.48 TRINITY_DN7665_c0_g1_i1:244-1935(+)